MLSEATLSVNTKFKKYFKMVDDKNAIMEINLRPKSHLGRRIEITIDLNSYSYP